MFKAMNFEDGVLQLIDQRQLPHTEIWVQGDSLEIVAQSIESMVVRGAPAIGCAAAWGLAVDAVQFAKKNSQMHWRDYKQQFLKNVERLSQTRPTAVNLFYALNFVKASALNFEDHMSIDDVARSLTALGMHLEDDDIRTCKAIGENGAGMFSKPVTVLTHCNTGSLATAGYGTALGIIRSLAAHENLKSVFVDETRPYLQGSRLTAFELSKDEIPYRLISDNMAAYAMQKGLIDVVVVGADRIAANGDTANKIGTYGLAVLCAFHKIPFVVAAPTATIDTKINSGAEILVEERPPLELLEINKVKIAPSNANVWNPSFDVTPAALISAIVTENAVHKGIYNFKVADYKA